MNRRQFVKATGASFAGAIFRGRLTVPHTAAAFRTKHVIWITNGNGSRKKDWYGNPVLCPNYARIAREGFVYEESHNDTVARHAEAWRELMTGRPDDGSNVRRPTPLHYVRKAYGDSGTKYWFVNGVDHYRQWRFDAKSLDVGLPGYGDGSAPVVFTVSTRRLISTGLTGIERDRAADFLGSLRLEADGLNLKNSPIPREPFISDAAAFAAAPHILKEFKPRMLILHQSGHDVAHETGYAEYEQVCRTTDEQIGRIFDFVKNDPYFSTRTAIVIRPEFGRDDDINRNGRLNHSEGYYQTHRSAEIWWGPDIRSGVHKGVTNRIDFVPSLTSLFNVNAVYAEGRTHTEMFKPQITRI